MTLKNSFEQAIKSFPTEGQNNLKEIFLADDFCGVIPAKAALQLTNVFDISTEQLMLELIVPARLYAKPPLSNYQVGVVSQGLTGNLYLGGNIEFSGGALNSTIHAEQAAIMNAWIHGEQGLASIAIGGTPCGHCRQFINELSTAMQLRVILPNTEPIPIATLLPGAFGPHSLNNQGGMMQPENHQLHLVTPSEDQLVLAALEMANKSYAPYSKSYSGVALLAQTGQIYAGPYAENVAFNPSVSPLQAALIQMNMCGQPFDSLQAAVLVETREAACSQVDVSRVLLRSVSEVELHIAYAEPE